MRVLILSVLIVGACARSQPGQTLPASALWTELQALCGKAFAGKMIEGTAPSDQDFAGETMVMHLRSCTEHQIRIPFHVGKDRSRTWVLTRLQDGYRLKHDHRHEDGSEDAVTQYGGDTRGLDAGPALEFYADAYTAKLLPAAAANIWTMAVKPDKSFRYALRREAENRRFAVEFDLARPVPAPPAPWGY